MDEKIFKILIKIERRLAVIEKTLSANQGATSDPVDADIHSWRLIGPGRRSDVCGDKEVRAALEDERYYLWKVSKGDNGKACCKVRKGAGAVEICRWQIQVPPSERISRIFCQI